MSSMHFDEGKDCSQINHLFSQTRSQRDEARNANSNVQGAHQGCLGQAEGEINDPWMPINFTAPLTSRSRPFFSSIRSSKHWDAQVATDILHILTRQEEHVDHLSEAINKLVQQQEHLCVQISKALLQSSLSEHARRSRLQSKVSEARSSKRSSGSFAHEDVDQNSENFEDAEVIMPETMRVSDGSAGEELGEKWPSTSVLFGNTGLDAKDQLSSERMLSYSQAVNASQSCSAEYVFRELPNWRLNEWRASMPRASEHETKFSMFNTVGTKNFRKIVNQLEEEERRAEIIRDSHRCVTRLQPCIMSPMSKTSMFIDNIAASLILYDCVAVPLLLLQATEATDHVVMNFMFGISRIFWTLQIPRSFLTGYMRQDGSVETSPLKVARQYRNTWFTLDLAIVVSDWLDATAGSVVPVLRFLKATRLARMVRIANTLSRKLKAGNSEIMLLWMKVIKDTIAFLLLNHILACIWFWVGILSGDHGWVSQLGITDADFTDKYLYVLHWSASQFIGSTELMPKTAVERGFGALVLLFAFVWSVSLISSITAAMTRLQMLSGQKVMLFSSLNKYLEENRISKQLTMRVGAAAKFYLAEKERNQPEENIQLLQMLSEPMLIEIHYEVHAHILLHHPFFWRYNQCEPLALQRLCHSAVTVLALAVGDIVFSQGEEPIDPRMFFPTSGTLLYMKDFDKDGDIDLDEMMQVNRSMWVCEPVLWMKWRYVGNLRAAANCTLLTLSAEKFCSIISEYKSTIYPAHYATELVSQLNRARDAGETVDDLCGCISIHQIVTQVFPDIPFSIHGTMPSPTSFLSPLAKQWSRRLSGAGSQ